MCLNWILSKGNDIFVIPGTTKSSNLKDNNNALHFRLTQEEMKQLDKSFPVEDFENDRYMDGLNQMSNCDTV